MKKELIYTENLHTGYQVGNKDILISQIPDLQLVPGQFLAIIGKNGIGKSTLLRTLSGLQKTLKGKIRIGENDLNGLSSIQKARRISLVLTDSLSLAFFSVYELVALGRYPHSNWQGHMGPEDHRIIEKALHLCASWPFKDRDVQSLSDGQRQRVLIARALAQDTPFLMLDEPTLHLDIPSRKGIFQLLRELSRKENKGVLIVSHETDLARLYCDKFWLMYTPPGQPSSTIQAGLPEDLMIQGIYQKAFENELLPIALNENKNLARIHLKGDQNQGKELSEQALLRAGFALVPEAEASIVIIIKPRASSFTWVLDQPQTGPGFASLEKLIEALKKISREMR